ncbi:hypothetical protein IH981_00210 [Patescibacteria group bacterium]|nr:hypothetical protein [Patescibacteria group bacterium]
MFKKDAEKDLPSVAGAEEGQALIELILAIAIATVLLSVLATGAISAREGLARSDRILGANALLQKEIEAVRSIRESGWNSFSTPGTYHTKQSGNSWVVVGGSIVDGDFTRGFTVASVCRQDPTSDPIDCGDPQAISDPSIKEITATVSWSFLGSQSVSSTFYISRYFGNQTWVQSTESEFNQGTTQGTVVVNNSGGEIELEQSSGGSWQAPQVVQTHNTPGADGQGIFVQGNYAYMVSGGGGDDFFIFDITDPENISLAGSLNLGANGYAVFAQGNYAYVASANNKQELQIIDVTNKNSPTLVGTYDAPGKEDGRGVFVVGNTAYLSRISGKIDEFITVDVSTPTSPTPSDSIDLASNGNSIYVSGSYAYVATSHNTREITVINISDPTNISLESFYNSSGTADGLGIFIDSSTAYLTTASGGDDFYILDVSTISSISLVGSMDLGGDGNDVFVSNNLAFVGTDNPSKEFQIVNISTPSSPSPFGSLNLNSTVFGVYVVGDFAYLADADNGAEFQVVKGGAATPFLLSGMFESQSFDATSIVGFNFLTWSATEPAGTNIQFRVATNNDNSTWNFVGPDGTNATFYENPEAFPLNFIEGRYVRFKIFLSGDGSTTPVVEDVTVNYSP